MTDRIDDALSGAERALDEGRGLKGTGFWPAIAAVKRDRALIERYADRAGAIDRRAFERGVKLRVPLAAGLTGLIAMTVLGVVAICASSDVEPPALAPIAFLVGFGALIVGTHSLAHWIVGRLLGIRFTHVFLGGPPPPRPGVKTDYATYLRASGAKRAGMHASGAVVTKIVPFALIPFAPDGYPWLLWILLAVGVIQIVTDIFLSTKVSDWMKVRRELRATA
jgi:hypothetical protein